MKEIGGYFGLEDLIHNEYYSDLIALNTGRNALIYLMKARNIRKIYLPYFLCDSVSLACEKFGVSYERYRIGNDFFPVFNKELEQDEYLYIVNFYGQISNADARRLKERYGNIIFDNVQAFFQKPIAGIDTIYSCRKFFGVPDGAYLSTDAKLDEVLEKDKSKDRMRHLLGRFEENASQYYIDFKNNDSFFQNLELKRMSELTHNILGAIDYEKVRKKREDNYNMLADALGKKNKLNFKTPAGPFCYPFYCENGMIIKEQLAKEKIYVPTLWPNVTALDFLLEKAYAENILPLPCDQRYDLKDMGHLVENIIRILK